MAWNFEEAVAWYRSQGAPREQSAVIGLLRELQQAENGISQARLGQIAEAYAVKEGFLLAFIRRIPGLRLAQGHCLELCAGPNCPMRAKLAEFVEKTYGKEPRGFTVRQVPCMRLCGKGPNIRWDGTVYHQADEALIRKLTEHI